MEMTTALVWLVVSLAGFAIYFIPAIIACIRHHRRKVAILVLNILAGWTVLGWVGALIWALVSERKSTPSPSPTSS